MATGIHDDDVASALQIMADNILQFSFKQIKVVQPRYDYCGLLELTIIFSGGAPHREVHFVKPGAMQRMHRTRLMTRLIYALKMFAFRDNFPLTSHELKGMKSFGFSGVKHQVKYWFWFRLPVAAPKNDLDFQKRTPFAALSDDRAAKGVLQRLVNNVCTEQHSSLCRL